MDKGHICCSCQQGKTAVMASSMASPKASLQGEKTQAANDALFDNGVVAAPDAGSFAHGVNPAVGAAVSDEETLECTSKRSSSMEYTSDAVSAADEAGSETSVDSGHKGSKPASADAEAEASVNLAAVPTGQIEQTPFQGTSKQFLPTPGAPQTKRVRYTSGKCESTPSKAPHLREIAAPNQLPRTTEELSYVLDDKAHSKAAATAAGNKVAASPKLARRMSSRKAKPSAKAKEAAQIKEETRKRAISNNDGKASPKKRSRGRQSTVDRPQTPEPRDTAGPSMVGESQPDRSGFISTSYAQMGREQWFQSMSPRTQCAMTLVWMSQGRSDAAN